MSNIRYHFNEEKNEMKEEEIELYIHQDTLVLWQ